MALDPNLITSDTELHIGTMSGTSMDGIDGILASFDSMGKPTLLAHIAHEFTPELKNALMELQLPADNELHKEALAGNAIATAYADVVHAILSSTGFNASQVKSIGAHGQTIRHQPGLHDGMGYTIQTLNASLLAELTNIDVIADFRSRDVAAKGQGAPLVPAFHAAQFGSDQRHRSILNLGGIANLTVLPKSTDSSRQVIGFDCGPGNVLLDLWINRHQSKSYDVGGAWASQGQAIPELLEALISEKFISQKAPKSTGRDLFNEEWLDAILNSHLPYAPQDVQTTLAHYTAIAAVKHILEYQPNCDELLVCGGGVRNHFLMDLLSKEMHRQSPEVTVSSTSNLGIDPQTVEALAFAWLAWAYAHNAPANLPAVTGARGSRILGARYPA
jgi:anhydro-N-acetylmuramic acid kinase